jgi:hypothetical protein
MYQSYPSSGQPGGPLRPAAPAPVLAAVRLMYAAAAVITVTLIISATLIDSTKASLRKANPGLTAPQVRDLTTLITLAIISGLALIALWLWMARADGQGRNWARILSAVLFALATLQLRGDFTQPASHPGSGVTVLYYAGTVLFAAAWLAGAAAVWQLWRPASRAFFQPQGFTQTVPRRG